MIQEPAVRAAAPGASEAFSEVLARALSARINAERYRIWFENRTHFSLHGDTLVVGVPNLHAQEWLQNQFASEIQAAANEATGRPVALRFRIDSVLFRAGRAAQAAARAPEIKAPPTPVTAPSPRPASSNDSPVIEPVRRRWRQLSSFIVGACNRVAHASALSAVDCPGQGPNPLIIHGPVGTGKTHLLEGIYVALRRTRPDLRVVFVTAEDFTNRFITAMRFGKQGSFRKHFRHCDALLLDDLQFLARKRATQVEFQHTFDALLEAGKQVVITSDSHPRYHEEFSAELLDRLLGGAIWGVMPPDADTRLQILRAKAQPRRLPPGDAAAAVAIPDDVLAFVAEQLRGNVRELEGALHTLQHYARLTRRPLDRSIAREALAELLRHTIRAVHVQQVDRSVCSVLQLPLGSLQNRQRAWSISHARMVAIHLCRKHTSASFSEISSYFGGQSHSAAIAADRKVRTWIENDSFVTAAGRRWTVRELIERVERELRR